MQAAEHRFRTSAIAIAGMNMRPASPAPCPSDTRQLIETMRPIETETTFLSPSGLSVSLAMFPPR